MESSKSEAIPTGLHCSNYKAEGEAIIHAAHTIKCKVDNNTQVVFLTDALSVLQALMNDNLHQLEQALYTQGLPWDFMLNMKSKGPLGRGAA
jgi:hypothetical protein